MNKQENFEDNLFLLMGRIRIIRDTLILDADSQLFFEKTLEDIDFIDKVLDQLLQRLTENNWLMDREIFFNHLFELEWQFSNVLTEIMNGSASIPVNEFGPLKERIMLIRKKSLERQRTVESIGNLVDNELEEPVINSNELNILLKDF